MMSYSPAFSLKYFNEVRALGHSFEKIQDFRFIITAKTTGFAGET